MAVVSRRRAGSLGCEAEIEGGEAEPAGAGISGEQHVGEHGVGRTDGDRRADQLRLVLSFVWSRQLHGV